MLLDFQKLVESFEKVIKNNGKTRFEDWFYDLSFKSSIAVSFFTFGLCFCVLYPFISVLVLLFLICQFYIDKYNLMYIYPLEFESQRISRKTLVTNSFYAVILFQLCVIGVGSL